MENFIPYVGMVSLVIAIINFVKFVKAKDTNGWVTQLSVWVAGVIVIFLAAQTNFANRVQIGDQTLDQLNIWSQVFVGLLFGASALVLNDFKKAFDGNDSAKKPPLI